MGLSIFDEASRVPPRLNARMPSWKKWSAVGSLVAVTASGGACSGPREVTPDSMGNAAGAAGRDGNAGSDEGGSSSGSGGTTSNSGGAGQGGTDTIDGGAGAGGVSQDDGPLGIETSKLTVQFNQPVQLELQAHGGRGARAWKLASGALPDGLTLAASGTISGRALVAGSFEVKVELSDAAQEKLTATIAIEVVRSKRWLAYIADHQTFGKDDLYVADLAQPAKLPKRVVLPIGSDSDVLKAVYSPDGSRIACIARDGSKNALFVVNADGTGAVNVSKGLNVYTGAWTSLAWSADSSLLAFSVTFTGAPDYFVVGPALDGNEAPRQLADFGQTVPALDVRWLDQTRLAIVSNAKFYSVTVPAPGESGKPEELLIPNLPSQLPGPPVMKPAYDPRLLFFYVGDFTSGNVYLADFTQASTAITPLGLVPSTSWQPSPDGKWLQYREFGMEFSTVGPSVRAVDGSVEAWKQTGTGDAFWALGKSTLYWTESKTSKLLFTTFGAAPSTEEHVLSTAATIVARADDNVHLLLKSASNQIFLWSGQAKTLFTASGGNYGFAPYAGVFASIEGDASPHPLRLGRTTEADAASTLWTPAPAGANVIDYAFAADGSAVLFRAKQSAGEQLYRVDLLSGKPAAQTVHALAGCAAANQCPAVKAFVMQP